MTFERLPTVSAEGKDTHGTEYQSHTSQLPDGSIASLLYRNDPMRGWAAINVSKDVIIARPTLLRGDPLTLVDSNNHKVSLTKNKEDKRPSTFLFKPTTAIGITGLHFDFSVPEELMTDNTADS